MITIRPAASASPPRRAAAVQPAAATASTAAPSPAPGWQPRASAPRLEVVQLPASPRTYSPDTARGAAALAELAYAPPAEARQKLLAAGYTNVEWVGNEQSGTQALVASRGDGVVVAFRGTSSGRDVATDLMGGAGIMRETRFGGSLHAGFAGAYESVEGPLRDAIARAQQGDPSKPILLTGHSLGGALAQISATDLRERGAMIAGVYTFGQPRVGDVGFTERYKALGLGAKTFRHINQNDPVPVVPKLHGSSAVKNVFAWLRGEDTNRFKHVGHVVYFDPNGTRTLNPPTEQMQASWRDTSWLTSLTNGRVSGLAGFVRSAPHHAMAEYRARVDAAPR